MLYKTHTLVFTDSLIFKVSPNHILNCVMFRLILLTYIFLQDDCLLKVWYPMTGWKSSIIPQDHHEVKRRQGSTQFSFVYLAHPRAVAGFSWRKTSKYMPRLDKYVL